MKNKLGYTIILTKRTKRDTLAKAARIILTKRTKRDTLAKAARISG